MRIYDGTGWSKNSWIATATIGYMCFLCTEVPAERQSVRLDQLRPGQNYTLTLQTYGKPECEVQKSPSTVYTFVTASQCAYLAATCWCASQQSKMLWNVFGFPNPARFYVTTKEKKTFGPVSLYKTQVMLQKLCSDAEWQLIASFRHTVNYMYVHI